MELLPTKTPEILKKLTPNWLWNIPTTEKKIYLTFDDGPIPEVTPFILETLDKYVAKATFFCLGANIISHPEILANCLAKGHCIGNHTHNHLNGWKTPTPIYLENVHKASLEIDKNCPSFQNSLLFRPPYGKITAKQSKALKKLGYDIVMWDVLPRDWKKQESAERCLQKILNYTKSGSIVVLHDSIKAYPTMSYVLPKMLSHFTNLGYTFESLC